MSRPKLDRPVLTIVVPALNEEAVIASTLERCLAARDEICRRAGLSGVEVICVSDGSTDRTEELARTFDDVSVLAFERNQGYGAAIMCGFEYGRGDLVGFLDADGTCDPLVFGDLCGAILTDGADVALGSRLEPGSRMPLIRQLGNLVFRAILGVLSRVPVRDTASGMRVIRRDALPRLYPLPTGLHFTPAMSARVLLEDELRLAEIPMPYAERVGRSKLSVVKDGGRFLVAILKAAVTFRPARLLLPLAALVLAAAMALGLWSLMLVRTAGHSGEAPAFVAFGAALFAAFGVLLGSTAVVSERIAATAHTRAYGYGGVTGTVSRLFKPRARWIGAVTLLAAAVGLLWPAIEALAAGTTPALHWSRAMPAAFCLLLSATWVTTTFLLNMMDLIHTTRAWQVEVPKPDRVKAARA